MIVLDTSAVVAYMNRGDSNHRAVRSWIEGGREELVTTPLAVAEMDHLVARFGGRPAADRLRKELRVGAYAVEWWAGALADTLAVVDGHPGMEVGLTDASLVALGAKLQTARVATLDERHFRTLRPLTGEPAFTLLPADT